MNIENISDIFNSREANGKNSLQYDFDEKTYREISSGYFSPIKPEVSRPAIYEGEGREIFVVSDLHIAGGRNLNGVYKGTENFFSDEAFGRFLNYINAIKRTPSAVLLFNGDLFDFLRVTEYPGWARKLTLTSKFKLLSRGYKPEMPDKPQQAEIQNQFNEWSSELNQLGIKLSPDTLENSISKKEKIYGLETDDYKTIYKLIRIKKGHPVFFISLASWMISGNRILITKGNHDLELYHEQVRNYIELMLGKSAADLSPGHSLKKILEEIIFPNIRFVDDSVVIDGDTYVEHGHRYDKFTMVTPSPLLSKNPAQINFPFGSFFNRYLINRVELYYPYFDKIRPAGNIIPMLIKNNFPLAVKIIFRQIPFCVRMLSTNGKYIWFMFNRVFWLLLGILIPLVFLISTHLSQIIHFIIEELTSTKETSILAKFILKTEESAVLILLSYFVSRVVAWFQLTEPDSLVKFARERLEQEKSNFRIMTMGHTHNPGAYTLPNNVKFFNTGTWIPVIETSSVEIREDKMYTFLHLERDADGLLQPAAGGVLLRWNDDAGRAEPQLLIERK